jgi:ribosome-associated toxin RatA of RatAB toxin-antitoxin module
VVAADIAVAWHGLSFTFTTRNPKRRPEWLAVRLERGPFRRLEGEWRIKALAPGACRVDFSLSCEPQGILARGLAGLVLERFADRLMEAYVARADAMYGPAADPQEA